MRNRDGALSPVRPHWLVDVIAQSQTIACRLHLINPDDLERLMKDFVHTLPGPSTQVERLVLRAILLDVAWQCGESIHARVHRTEAPSCAFVPAAMLQYFWKAPAADPCAGFTRWVHAFSREFERSHPSTPASRAAKLIRDNFGRKWNVAVLAKAVHATPSQLRRHFVLDFGLPIREYQRAARIMAALHQLPSGKIDAIATQVGTGAGRTSTMRSAR